MHRTAGVAFYMYSGDNFLKQAKVRLRSVVSDKAVEEAKEVREEQQQPRGRLDPRLIEAFKMSLGPNFKVGGREPLWKPLRSHWMQRARSSYHDDIDFAPGDLERLLERMTPEERERLVANLERALGPVEEPREEPPEDVAKRHRDAAS